MLAGTDVRFIFPFYPECALQPMKNVDMQHPNTFLGLAQGTSQYVMCSKLWVTCISSSPYTVSFYSGIEYRCCYLLTMYCFFFDWTRHLCGTSSSCTVSSLTGQGIVWYLLIMYCFFFDWTRASVWYLLIMYRFFFDWTRASVWYLLIMYRFFFDWTRASVLYLLIMYRFFFDWTRASVWYLLVMYCFFFDWTRASVLYRLAMKYFF